MSVFSNFAFRALTLKLFQKLGEMVNLGCLNEL